MRDDLALLDLTAAHPNRALCIPLATPPSRNVLYPTICPFMPSPLSLSLSPLVTPGFVHIGKALLIKSPALSALPSHKTCHFRQSGKRSSPDGSRRRHVRVHTKKSTSADALVLAVVSGRSREPLPRSLECWPCFLRRAVRFSAHDTTPHCHSASFRLREQPR